MSLTVYIPRYVTDEQTYDMFINCVEHVKHIKGFDTQIIVLCDNETELTKIGDPLLQKEYNNITFIENPLKGIPEFAGYYHFLMFVFHIPARTKERPRDLFLKKTWS